MRLGGHKMSFSVIWGTLGDWCILWKKLLLSLHAYSFLNTNRRQCVVENDCVWSCLIKLQSSLLSELSMASTPYEVSKYLCMERSLACPSRIEFLPFFDRRPSGSLYWKTQIACPFWDFFLLGSIHFWLLNVLHFHSQCGRCTRWSLLATVHCVAL